MGVMTKLEIPARQAALMWAHMSRAYPQEGCGVLLGTEEGGMRRVEEVVALENVHPADRRNRYEIAPERLLETEKRAREAGLDLLGFFHSHPDRPAEPSRFDLERAWPYYSYLIASVVAGEVVDVRSFRRAGDGTRFEAEAVTICPERGAPEPERGSE